MVSAYSQVAEQAFELTPAERWRLVTELLGRDGRPSCSAKDLFGANGPIEDDVDARIRRSRDE